MELSAWGFMVCFEELLLPQWLSPWTDRVESSWPAACSGELAAARNFLQSGGRWCAGVGE